MEDLLAFADTSDGSVGSAVKVVYDKDFAEKHNIGRFGRMTIKEDKRIFHAGSKSLDDQPLFKYTEMDVGKVGSRFRDGQDLQLNLDKMTTLNEWPEPLYKQKNWGLASIEKDLFAKLGGVITLVNPSFRTMQALDAMSGQASQGYVYLTNTYDVEYTKGVMDFIMKSNWLQSTETIMGVAYLGSGQPNYFPPTPWVRLIPSPYLLPCALFQQYVSHWNENGYSCTYERKPGYFVNNMLQFDVTTYVYNPETVDETFRDEGRPTHLAFLESSIPLKVVEKDEKRVYHKPRFLTLPNDAEWVEKNGSLYLIKDRIIYDKKGTGTYFSRRGRDVPPLMYQWAPYLQHGSHWLTLSSLRPRKDYNVDVIHEHGSTFVCFGNTRPVHLERVLSTQKVWIDETEAPTRVKAVTTLKEVGMQDANGREGKKRTVPRRPWRPDGDPIHERGNAEMEIRSEYWKDALGQVYPYELRREDAIVWLHQLNNVPNISASLGKEVDLKTVPRFCGKSGISFVDVAGLTPGTYYLCPNRDYLVLMIPQAARYYSRNYLNVFTYGPYAKSVEIDGEEYQSKMNPEWNSIILEFQKTVVTNQSDNARTEIAVAETLGMSVSLVSRYIRVHPDMRLWKVGVEGKAQWVHRAYNRVRFPEGDQLSGTYWEDVMDSRLLHETVHDVTGFRKYCLNNGYGFLYHDVSLDKVQFEVKGRK